MSDYFLLWSVQFIVAFTVGQVLCNVLLQKLYGSHNCFGVLFMLVGGQQLSTRINSFKFNVPCSFILSFINFQFFTCNIIDRCWAANCFVSTAFLIHRSHSTIDINLAEFQYISDHLTEKECLQLVAALHFHSFELPKDMNASVRRLSKRIPCIDLLLHWNSTPGEGKGQTVVEVCHRLNQIGREDLAQWLSKTVFHEISKNLNFAFDPPEMEGITQRSPFISEVYSNEEIIDEAAWLKIDSLMEILIVMGLSVFIFGSFFMCFLNCSRSRRSGKGYGKVAANEN